MRILTPLPSVTMRVQRSVNPPADIFTFMSCATQVINVSEDGIVWRVSERERGGGNKGRVVEGREGGRWGKMMRREEEKEEGGSGPNIWLHQESSLQFKYNATFWYNHHVTMRWEEKKVVWWKCAGDGCVRGRERRKDRSRGGWTASSTIWQK